MAEFRCMSGLYRTLKLYGGNVENGWCLRNIDFVETLCWGKTGFGISIFRRVLAKWVR